MMQSVRGVELFCHTKKDGVKCNFFRFYVCAYDKPSCWMLEASSWCPGLMSLQYFTSTRWISLLLAVSSWFLRTYPWNLACCICCKWGVEGELDLVGKGVTKIASGQEEVSLSITDKRASKAKWVKSYYLHAWEFEGFVGQNGQCCQHLYELYKTAKEPLLMAFMMSLQATLWRSVIMPEKILCWHPERLWRAQSNCWQNGTLKASGLFKADSMFLTDKGVDKGAGEEKVSSVSGELEQ